MGHFLKKRKVYEQDGVVVPTGLDTDVDLIVGNLVTGNATVTSIPGDSIVFTDTNSTLISSSNLTFDGTTLSVTGDIAVDDLRLDGNSLISVSDINLTPASGNVTINTGSTGELTINGTGSMLLPVGTDAQRPISPTYGEMRFNTDTQTVEVYQIFDGNSVWFPLTPNYEINTQTETGDGITTQWLLEQYATADSLIVTLNGVLQEPGAAYTTFETLGTSYIQFASAPAVTDTIFIRFISAVSSVTKLRNGANDTFISLETGITQDISVKGDLLPIANLTYNLGSNGLRWNELWLAGSTIYLGNLVLKDNGDNTLGVYESDGVTEAIVTSSSDNAQTADKWTTARILTLSGDVSGNVSIDGSSNINLTTVVADDSHLHTNYAEKTSEQVLRATDALQVANGNEVTIVKGDDTTESVTVQGTLTTLSFSANTLTYVDEAGNSTTIDLSLYLDDTNLAYIQSGTVDGNTGIATFTRDDASTFTVDFSALFDDTNLARVESGSFNATTGLVTFTRNDLSTFTVDLSALLTAGPGSGLDADTVDGKHYDDIIADATAIAIALG